MPIAIDWNARLDLRAHALADYCRPRANATPPYPAGLAPAAAALATRLLAGDAPLLACRVAQLDADAAWPADAGAPCDYLLQLTPGLLWGMAEDEFARHFAREDILEPHIRVFLSSTFRDMLAERNFLATQVLPAVRRHCVLRGVQFTEIDLRWGITEEEARRGDVTHLCLREIDLSRHSRPFFIGMLGERYGWVPDAGQVDAVLAMHDFGQAQRAELLAASVTELEILYGPLRDLAYANGALFYLRSPALSAALAADSVDDANPVAFIDADPAARAAQAHLKDRLRAARVVRVDGYDTVAQAGADIQRMLLAEVERLSRGAAAPAQWLAARRLADEALPRAAESAWLSAWAERPAGGGRDNLLLLAGEPGSGKSTLLAHWMRDYQASHPDTGFVFYPFVGGGGSTPLQFIHFVLQSLGLDDDDFATLVNQDLDMQVLGLHRILARIDTPLIIVADGIDVLGDERRTSLQWVPADLAPQVKMILSSNLAQHDTALARRGAGVHHIGRFDAAEADAFIQHYLARFGKRLPEDLRRQLAAARLGGNPQFLRMALDELRLDASHEGLSERIAAYMACATRREACGAVLANWRRRARAGGLEAAFDRAARALLASADGLPETVLQHRLGLAGADASRVLGFAYAHFLRPGGRIGVPDGDWRQALAELLGATPADIDAWRMELVEALCAMPADLIDPTFAAHEFARQFVALLRDDDDGNHGAPTRAARLAWVHGIALGQGRIWQVVERANEQLPMLWSALGSGRDAFDAAFAAQAAGSDARAAMANAAYVLLGYQLFWQAARACARRALDLARAADDAGLARDCAELLLKALAEDAAPHFAEAETLMHLLIDDVTDPNAVPVERARQAAEAQRLFAKVALECNEVDAAEHFARQAAFEYALLLHRLQGDDAEGGITAELLSQAAHASNVAARVLRERRRPQEAEVFYAQAISFWSTAYAADNYRVLVAEHERADVLVDCGPERYAEADALLEHAIAHMEDIGAADFEAYRVRRKLYDRQGRHDLAIEAAGRAIALQRQAGDYLEGDEAPTQYDLALTLMRAGRERDALAPALAALRHSVDARRPRDVQFLAGAAGLAYTLLARLDADDLAFFLIRAADDVIEARQRASGGADGRAVQMWRQATAQTLEQAGAALRALPVPPLADVLDQADALLAQAGGAAPAPAGAPAPATPPRHPLGTVARSGARCPESGVWQAGPAPDAAPDTGGRTVQRRFRAGENFPEVEAAVAPAPGLLARLFGARRPAQASRAVEWVLTAYLPPA